MTAAGNKRIIIDLDADTSERLEAAAILEGVSVDVYCREAIEVQLDEDAAYRAPIKLTRESAERCKRNRERTANANNAKSAAVGEHAFGDKPVFAGNSADDIQAMREERALNIERAVEGRRRKPRD